MRVNGISRARVKRAVTLVIALAVGVGAGLGGLVTEAAPSGTLRRTHPSAPPPASSGSANDAGLAPVEVVP